MARTSIQVDSNTLAALNECKWQYRAKSLHQVIDLLICEAEPDIYHEYISEDDPEE